MAGFDGRGLLGQHSRVELLSGIFPPSSTADPWRNSIREDAMGSQCSIAFRAVP